MYVCYILTKYIEGDVVLEERKADITRRITTRDISDKLLVKEIQKISQKLRLKCLKYAEKYLISMNGAKNVVNMDTHGDTKLVEEKQLGEHYIKNYRNYYDSRGRLFEKLFGYEYLKKKQKK